MRLWLLAVALAAVGCPSSAPKSDDTEATPTFPPPPIIPAPAASTTGPVAKNAAKIQHYPTEKALPYVLITIKSLYAFVSTAAGGGEAVAILKAAEPVMLVGEYESFQEILFNNPSDPSTKLGGWVLSSVFDDPSSATATSRGAKPKIDGGPLPSGAPPSKCGPYQHYDEVTRKCRPFACPSGYYWSEPMQACLMTVTE